MHATRRFLRPSALAGRLAIVAVPVLLGLAYVYAARPAESPGERLVDLLLAERFTSGRLTGQTAWQRCVPVDTAALVPRVRCGTPLQPRTRRYQRIADARRDARLASTHDSSLSALRGSAFVDLWFADPTSAALDRAAVALERAHRRAPGDAGVLNDLAVTYLAVGERTQQLTPMLRALDAVERAVAADSLDLSILFNRALILQRLYLIESAERAWERYLAVERDPRWRDEAEALARQAAQAPDTVSWGTLRRSPPEQMDVAARDRIARIVRNAPHAARDSSFVLLGDWGTAVERLDSARAARLLALVRALGAAADSAGADHGMSLIVATLDSASAMPARLSALAEGHRLLASGYGFFYEASYEKATASLARAEHVLRAAGSPAGRWAAFYRAAAEFNLGHYDSAEHRLASVRAQATANESGLVAKSTWALGVSQIRQGNYAAASRFYREAAPLVVRAREPENVGAISYMLSESLALANQYQASRAEGLRGLRHLSPYRGSNFLNNHLTTVAAFARADGLSHASFAVMGEVLIVAHTLGNRDVIARAHRARARDLIALGRTREARMELDTAAAWAAVMPPGAGGDRVRADVELVLGQMLRPADPDSALRVLSGVVETFRTVGIGMNLPRALYEAGMAAEAAGRRDTARSFIRQAIEVVERQQATFTSMEEKAAFHETTENVFDAMIRLQIAAARPDSAFAYLERARAAIQPIQGPRAIPPPAARTLDGLRATLPDGVLFVDYALLDQQVAIWTVSRRGWRHRTLPVRRDSIAALVRRFTAETGEAGPNASQARARLFDLLIRPVAREMEGARHLVVAPDRELSQVPFAALWDRRARRYVVEDYVVTTVPSATFYLLASARAPRRPGAGAALVVGNPALDPETASRLGSLPGAVAEAEQVAALYRERDLLTGPAARRQTLLQLLPRHSVFHFAGHAVFDGEQPGSSYLALAPDPGSADGNLRAREIGELRLSNMQVVVLSACSTLGSRPSRAGAAAGLAYSFLHAGAPATVSTLWDVRDDATAPLLVEFHRRLRGGAPAAAALRLAQLQALRFARDEARTPAAWAAFIYTGP